MRGDFKPPYLINPVLSRGDGVAVTADGAAGVVEVAVRGRWSPALRMTAWVAVTKCLVDHPEAVVVDLRALDDPLASSAPAWWTMRRTGQRMVPPVSVVICLPPTTALAGRLNRLGAKRYLPVFPTMTAARAAVAARLPMTERVQTCLAPQPDAAGRARALVADACRAWGTTPVRHRAELIVTELVDNAVRHTGTAVLVTLARRGAGIHLAVSDDDPRLPVLLDAPHRADPGAAGQGLRTVYAAATVWGAMPSGPGKVVWAVVHPGPS
jgi:hypothetical protein